MPNYPLSVFLDTNIYIGCKYDLGADSVLQLLKKLIDTQKVKLYISNIVIREVEKHIREDVSASVNMFKSARKEVLKYISQNMFENTSISSAFSLPSKDEIEGHMIDRFQRFLSDCKVICLDNAGVNIDLV
jgi:predicted nucleic acid-binding protein